MQEVQKNNTLFARNLMRIFIIIYIMLLRLPSVVATFPMCIKEEIFYKTKQEK